MRAVVSAVLYAGVLALSGCASAPARTPGTYVSQSEPVFLISEAQADQILVDAMNVEFGSDPIVRVEHPNKGYQATIKFLFDSHQIVATMVPSRGRSGDGSVQDGYYFNVTHSGTMPLSGMSRSKRLRERLSQAATALSPSVPAAR
ncbi:hypothetical protein [Brevundimonas vancanneytii]|uniref:Lipoprotein n=1 Tax=Brevundimonas vancanneytii TaxID=1325724 RepID=A0A4P1KH38_9CAUL|nr:hypothetical protein [Brevundimonas vancanneytii]VTO19727.1 Uncharacterised protein [Brevundimonas vancanneytii]